MKKNSTDSADIGQIKWSLYWLHVCFMQSLCALNCVSKSARENCIHHLKKLNVSKLVFAEMSRVRMCGRAENLALTRKSSFIGEKWKYIYTAQMFHISFLMLPLNRESNSLKYGGETARLQSTVKENNMCLENTDNTRIQASLVSVFRSTTSSWYRMMLGLFIFRRMNLREIIFDSRLQLANERGTSHLYRYLNPIWPDYAIRHFIDLSN